MKVKLKAVAPASSFRLHPSSLPFAPAALRFVTKIFNDRRDVSKIAAQSGGLCGYPSLGLVEHRGYELPPLNWEVTRCKSFWR